MTSQFLNADCMDPEVGLPSLADKSIGLAIVDPPFAIGMDGGKSIGLRKKWTNSYEKVKHLEKNWDNAIPARSYFTELNRVSVNWILWGGNYFVAHLDRVEHVIAWDKSCDGTSFSHFEIALTSFKGANRKYTIPIQQESQRRIHPCQKPRSLYKALLRDYAKPGDLILDTHVGSASSLIACQSMGFTYLGYELDPDYYAAAKRRMRAGVQKTLL